MKEFNSNLLTWSGQDMIAVGLGDEVHLLQPEVKIKGNEEAKGSMRLCTI
jgi:hypothetical protein